MLLIQLFFYVLYIKHKDDSDNETIKKYMKLSWYANNASRLYWMILIQYLLFGEVAFGKMYKDYGDSEMLLQLTANDMSLKRWDPTPYSL